MHRITYTASFEYVIESDEPGKLALAIQTILEESLEGIIPYDVTVNRVYTTLEVGSGKYIPEGEIPTKTGD